MTIWLTALGVVGTLVGVVLGGVINHWSVERQETRLAAERYHQDLGAALLALLVALDGIQLELASVPRPGRLHRRIAVTQAKLLPNVSFVIDRLLSRVAQPELLRLRRQLSDAQNRLILVAPVDLIRPAMPLAALLVEWPEGRADWDERWVAAMAALRQVGRAYLAP
jgi:hypothetical protein